MRLSREDFKRRLKEDEDLPLLPQVVISVQKTLDEEGSSAVDLARAILEDSVLTGRLLKLANSSFYRSSHKPIVTVTDAIVLLGFETVKNLTLSLSVFKLLSGFTRDPAYRIIWRHSLACALASRALARATKVDVPEAAFVAGLLHDIGKVMLAHYSTEAYRRVVEEVADNRPASEAEKEHLGLDHRQAGGILARHWRLPDDIAWCMIHHDDQVPPADQTSPFHNSVYVANHIAMNMYGTEKQRERWAFSVLSKEAKELLGMESDVLFKLINRLSEQVFEVARILDIAVDDMKITDPPMAVAAEEKADRLRDDLQRKNRELELLTDLNRMLARGENGIEIRGHAARTLRDILGLTDMRLAAVEDGRLVELPLFPGQATDMDIPVDRHDDVMIRCLVERAPVNTTNFDRDMLGKLPDQALFNLMETERVVIVPMEGVGGAAGILAAAGGDDRRFDESDEALLNGVAQVLALTLMPGA